MSLHWQLVRRLAFSVLAVFVVVSVLFAFITFTPDPNKGAVASAAVDPSMNASERQQAVQDALQKYRRARGLDEPILSRYIEWLVDIPTLDWGLSYGPIGTTIGLDYVPYYQSDVPVVDLVANALSHTLRYVLPAIVLAVVSGLGVGLYTATQHHTVPDKLATSAAILGFSIPNFWLGLILVATLGGSGLLAGITPNTSRILRTIVFPTVILWTSLFAGWMRYVRAESLEYTDTAFIKLVRAKGARQWRVARHLLRNAAVPVLSLIFSDLLGIVVLNIFVIEYVFDIPGLGGLSLIAFIERDLPVILGSSMVIVFTGIIGNFLADAAAVVLDPRTK